MKNAGIPLVLGWAVLMAIFSPTHFSRLEAAGIVIMVALSTLADREKT